MRKGRNESVNKHNRPTTPTATITSLAALCTVGLHKVPKAAHGKPCTPTKETGIMGVLLVARAAQ